MGVRAETFWVAIGLLAAGCAAEPAGLSESAPGGGPRVVWDLEARPLPEIPFPNDAATRFDPGSPTGRRLNLSLQAPTEQEAEVRLLANRLDGFGTFAPISLPLDAAVDLEDLARRHLGNRDLSDDAVFVIDVTPGSPGFGMAVVLDMGRGWFPLVLGNPDFYFPNDPRAAGSNLLFETTDEGEDADTDFDGVPDLPNTPPGGDPWEDLLLHWERETHTLLLRPVVPLREATTYAVVVTRRLRGAEGTGAVCAADDDCGPEGSCDPVAGRCRESVRSPFRWSHHLQQAEPLAPLEAILPAAPFSLDPSEVAFAWTFTTQSITRELAAIREGLHGRGPLSCLGTEFPPAVLLTPAKDEVAAAATGSRFVVTIDELLEVVGPLLPALASMIPSLADSMDVLLETYGHVRFVVAGTFESPDFLVDRDGFAAPGHPANDDETFELDPLTGEAVYGRGQVPFLCVIPKGEGPFSVALFLHGTASSKAQVLGFAGHFARLGIASCALDAFGHGMPFPANPPPGSLLSEATVRGMLDQFAPGYGPVYDIIKGSRARDINMDGNEDPAGDFWTMDPFHTRDCIRQTAVDLLQLARVLRSMDGSTLADMDGDGTMEVLGDFDGDGAPDLGGPGASLYAWGVSLGGIVTAVFAGYEPDLDAVALVAAGGGLTDVAIRSIQPGVPEMAVLPVLGPVFLVDPAAGGGVEIRFVMPAFDHAELLPVATLASAREGDTVRLTNLDTGDQRHTVVASGHGGRIQIPGDALRATEIRHYTGFDPLARLGGEPCSGEDSCGDGLRCIQERCACQEAGDCPAGWVCTAQATCRQAPPVLDTTLGTAAHPAMGDRLRLEVLAPDGSVREATEAFGVDVTANGVVYPAGAPLVNLYRGFGNPRQTPGFRRFITIAQTILEPADPVNAARLYGLEPLAGVTADPGELPGVPVLHLVGAGDPKVPTATGITLARAGGAVGWQAPDPRFGDRSPMDVLADLHVAEGVANRCRYGVEIPLGEDLAAEECVVYDVDDLDGSRARGPCSCATSEDPAAPAGWICTDGSGEPCGDGFGTPSDTGPPLRATATMGGSPAACVEDHGDGTCRLFREPAGLQAVRFPVTLPGGFHGIYLMAPHKAFDVETWQLNQIEGFFLSDGTELLDDPCLEDGTCPGMP
ncbi:MAG: hypothetical protein FJ098_05640 [Deltaproteobacteria bacterium]|nr:hypothetical protein [Deltaproteobacteria bacterium]